MGKKPKQTAAHLLPHLPQLPIWRRYGGWISSQSKVHIREPQNHPVTHAVLLLHGLSQNGAGMLLKNRADIRKEIPGALIISPDGIYGADPDQHMRARKTRARDKSFTWFELPQGRFRPREELAKLMRPSIDHVHNVLDKILPQYGLDESKLFIVGFSQGGAIAMQAALERPIACAGVANLCGPYFDPQMFGDKPISSRPPIFYGIDLGDEVTPAGLAYHAMTAMKRLKLPVTAHITDAGPAIETTYYNAFGKPYKAMTPQPGAPRVIEHYKPYRNEQGEMCTRLATVETTGHWVNDGMRKAMLDCFKHLVEQPGTTPRVEGTEQLRDRVTPRVTAKRVQLYWMVNPKRLTSRVPIEQRPMNSWNDLMWRTKQVIGHAINTAAQQAVAFASPLLFDVAEQVAVEVNDRRNVSQLFSSLARGMARVLIPEVVDLPPEMEERLETRTRRNEKFIKAGDVDAMMGTPKRPSMFRRLISHVKNLD